MTEPGTDILIAYDGSEPADNAVDHAARLFPGSPALIVTVWCSVQDASPAARLALPQGVIDEAVRKLDEAAEARALEIAGAGATRARAAGLAAVAVTRRGRPSVWPTIVALADEKAVAAVVVGARGASDLRTAVLGSVSNGVVHHSRRPVVVVHPAERAGRRDA